MFIWQKFFFYLYFKKDGTDDGFLCRGKGIIS